MLLLLTDICCTGIVSMQSAFCRTSPIVHGLDSLLQAVAWIMLVPETLPALFNAADSCLGAAIRSLGPRNFLELLPLNLDQPENSEQRREWLLASLRQHMSKGDIAYFASHIVPEMKRARELMHEQGATPSQGTGPGALYRKLWALLPAFLSNADDAKVSSRIMGQNHSTTTHTHTLSLSLSLSLSSSLADSQLFTVYRTSKQSLVSLASRSKKSHPRFR
jgi:hypothetical protein